MANPAVTYTEADIGAALKLFAGQAIKVQVATKAKKKGEDGKEREIFVTQDKPLAPELVLSAKQWSNGTVSITTSDGKRYTAKGGVAAAKGEAK